MLLHECGFRPDFLGLTRAFALLLLIGAATVSDVHAASGRMPMSPVISVIDEFSGKRLAGESLSTLSDPGFKEFVSEVSKQIWRMTGETAQRAKPAEGKPEVTLLFIRRPLLASTAAPVSVPIEPDWPKSEMSCRLDSPWAKISLARTPKLKLHGVFIWSERQMLMDQAMLAGAKADPVSPAATLAEAVFDRYVQDYENSVLQAATPQARETARVRVAERISPDVLWLLRHAWQGTLAPFSMEARYALDAAIARAAPHYTDLAVALSGRCLSAGKGGNYPHVLELQGVYDTGKYRIDRLH